MKALIRSTVALIVALVLVAGAETEARAQGSSGRAQVLVATFQTGNDVDSDFGKEIAEKLRERVAEFDLLVPLSKDDVEKALDQFDLDQTKMNLIQWRQLASRLNAQLIIYGTADRQGGGVSVQALFVEADREEQTEVPAISVDGSGGGEAEQVARQVAQALDEHVSYLSARLNCQDYLSGDQLDDAKRNCDKALGIRPNSARALYLRGRIAIEQENWEEAVDYLTKAYRENEDDEGIIQSLAYANAQVGNRERSVELYRKYLEFNPNDQDVRLSVAYNLANAGANAQAMEIIRDGLERDSTSAPLWKYLGDVAIQKGMAGDQQQVGSSGNIADTAAIRTALDAYGRYAELQPDSVGASLYRNMMGAQLQLGNTEAALELAEEALETVADRADRAAIYSLEADIFGRNEDVKKAISAMDSVLALDQERKGAHFKRGLFELRADQNQAAMEDFRAAIEAGDVARNQVAQSLYATGHNRYYQKDRFQQAAAMFETALEFAEEADLKKQLHFWTGYSYFRLGRQLDDSNSGEQCEPARRAASLFQKVLPHINQAGDYQTGSQQQIRQAVDVLIYRQEQIQKKSCG